MDILRHWLRIFYGIKEVKLIKATGLDIYGNDPEKIMAEAISGIEV